MSSLLFSGFRVFGVRLKTLILSLQENSKNFATRSYLTLTVIAQNALYRRVKNRGLEIFFGFLTCFMIYDLLYLILWEICRSIAGIFISLTPAAKTAGVLAADLLAAVTVILGYLYTKVIKTRTLTIPLGLNAPYRMVLLSDLHLGAFVRQAHVKKLVEKINALHPDMVVISGDLIDVGNRILADAPALSQIAGELAKIQAKDGVFAVLGNHDPYAGNEAFVRFLRESRIKLLHNEAVCFPGFNLVGRTDARCGLRKIITSFEKKIDRSKPVIVLDHDPGNIPDAVSFGASLVLCGHTHKGQFFPATLFTKWANGKHYFYGHEIFGKTHAVITSGAGFFQLPVRIGTSNEIVLMELK